MASTVGDVALSELWYLTYGEGERRPNQSLTALGSKRTSPSISMHATVRPAWFVPRTTISCSGRTVAGDTVLDRVRVLRQDGVKDIGVSMASRSSELL